MKVGIVGIWQGTWGRNYRLKCWSIVYGLRCYFVSNLWPVVHGYSDLEPREAQQKEMMEYGWRSWGKSRSEKSSICIIVECTWQWQGRRIWDVASSTSNAFWQGNNNSFRTLMWNSLRVVDQFAPFQHLYEEQERTNAQVHWAMKAQRPSLDEVRSTFAKRRDLKNNTYQRRLCTTSDYLP